MVRDLVATMRPRQWTKNLVIFAALVFGEEAVVPTALARSSVAFLIFCLLTSGVYIFNDIADVEEDRAHPRKRERPIAARRLNQRVAALFGIGLVALALGTSFVLSFEMGLTAAAYFLLQLGYTLFLKHIVIIDVMSVAAGFVMRAVAGAQVINVPISPWLLVCTTLLALFLALGKRRHELLLLEDDAPSHRRILVEYSPALLDQMISVVTSSTVVAYSLYTFFSQTAAKEPYLMLTIPFVIYGIFRYLYLVHQKNLGGSPEEILLGDAALIVDVVLWLGLVLLIFALR